jgi:hypothetical protein
MNIRDALFLFVVVSFFVVAFSNSWICGERKFSRYFSHLIERMTIDGMFNLTHIDMVKDWKRNPLNGVNIFTLYLDIRK